MLLCGCEASSAVAFQAEEFGALPRDSNPYSLAGKGFSEAMVWAMRRRRSIRTCSPVSSIRLGNLPPL